MCVLVANSTLNGPLARFVATIPEEPVQADSQVCDVWRGQQLQRACDVLELAPSAPCTCASAHFCAQKGHAPGIRCGAQDHPQCTWQCVQTLLNGGLRVAEGAVVAVWVALSVHRFAKAVVGNKRVVATHVASVACCRSMCTQCLATSTVGVLCVPTHGTYTQACDAVAGRRIDRKVRVCTRGRVPGLCACVRA